MLIFKKWFNEFEAPFSSTEEWENNTLDKIITFTNGFAFKSKDLLPYEEDNCYKVFKQGHIRSGGGFNNNATKSWYPKKSSSNLKKFILKKGDILMAMTDMKDKVAILGNTSIMPVTNEFILNQRVGLIRSNGYKSITYPYIYLLTNNKTFLNNLRIRANRGVQVNLSSKEIKKSKILIPPENLNILFSKITLPVFEKIFINYSENEKLIKIKKLLLPKLLSGEIDVSQIEL